MPQGNGSERNETTTVKPLAVGWTRFIVNLWPDRIATRIAVIMIAAMLLTQIFGYLLFLSDRSGLWPQTHLDGLVARIKVAVEAMLVLPEPMRAEGLRRFSGDDFTLDAIAAFVPQGQIANGPPFGRLRDHILLGMPGLVDQVMIEGRLLDDGPAMPPFVMPPDPAQSVILWLRLADHSWMTIRLPFGDLLPPPPFHPWLPWGAAFLVIIAISLFAARGISGSLRRFAQAAERLGVNIAAIPLVESGPGEMRSVTRAFNLMQARLKRFVDDRTQVLAAISHDLRTPLSRLRLRAECQLPGIDRQKNLADLDLMDRMIAATLSFARDDVAAEARVKVDLASLTQAVCDEIADAGGQAKYQGPLYLEIEAAPLSLMRAITNVVENAVKYGGHAQVRLVMTGRKIEIAVTDGGPGIIPSEQERVFEPFYRLDVARAPDGGTGLGLAIARHVLRAHGGDVILRNGDGGGLVATLILPRI